jgi:hypothetical protein
MFGGDTVLPIKFGRLGAIEQHLQKKMGHDNRRESASRISYDYKVGDKVLLEKTGKHLRKLEAPRTGPHTVTAIYTNGTVSTSGKVGAQIPHPPLGDDASPCGR